jgi:hypothetical protein
MSKSKARLFADLVKTFYSSETQFRSFAQVTVQKGELEDEITTIDTIPFTAASAVTFYVNATKDNESHFAVISAVKDGSNNVAFSEYGTIVTNGDLAVYTVDISNSSFRLRANPTEGGVAFKVTRITVES